MNRYPSLRQEPIYPQVATHLPVLWTLLHSISWRIVYEFGAGAYSTPLLSALTSKRGELLTGENAKKWIPEPKHSRHTTGTIPYIIANLTVGLNETVAFVDCEADLRAMLCRELLGSAEYIVVHDTEDINESAYKTRPELKLWNERIRVRCPYHYISTTVACCHPFPPVTASLLEALSDDPARHLDAWKEVQKLLGWS